MKKAVLFLGILISFLLVTSCTTDDLELSNESQIQINLMDQYTNQLARDGEEDEEESSSNENNEGAETTSTNEDDSTGPVIVIKKD
ncbi:hypothetical protein [Flavobacterium sp.]|jgi:hypothetical protein|uniref:hypothetical protein n=1 Tax=Flavobacterium sp. TaxID=239 RepID=UPI003D2E1861